MVYEADLKKLLNDNNLTKEEKVKQIKQYYESQRKQYDKNLNIFLIKIWSGELLELLSCLIPIGAGAKLGTTAGKALLASKLGKILVEKSSRAIAPIVKKVMNLGLKPNGVRMSKRLKAFTKQLKEYKEDNFLIRRFGRRIPSQVGAGVKNGAISGAIFGAGEGLQNDKDVLGESAKTAALGAFLSVPFSGISAFTERYLRGLKLKKYGNVDELEDDVMQKFLKDAKSYYQDYIQKIIIIKDGNIIEFTRAAVEEQNRWNLKQSQNFPELIKDIKKAKKLPDAKNIKPDKKPNVDYYEVYEGKNGRHYVEVPKKGIRRFYDNIRNTSDGSYQANSVGSKGSATNIVTDVPENVNPDSEKVKLLKLHVEKNVDNEGSPTGYAIPESVRSKNKWLIDVERRAKEYCRELDLRIEREQELRNQARINYIRQKIARRRELEKKFEEYFRTVLDDFIVRMGFDMHDYN